MTSGALRARAAASARSPAAASRKQRGEAAGERVDVARRVEALLRARPRRARRERAATVGSAGGHRLQRGEREDLGVAARDDRDGGRARAARRARSAETWPTKRAVVGRGARAAARSGPVPGDHEREARRGRTPRRRRRSPSRASGARRPARTRRPRRASASANVALDRAQDLRLGRRRARRGRAAAAARRLRGRRSRRRRRPGAAGAARARRRRRRTRRASRRGS